MSARRSKGEGSVYLVKSGPQAGRWRGAIDLGWQDGRRSRKVVTAPTKREALAKLKAVQRERDQGVRADGRMTVAKWLEHWLATVVDGRVGSDNTRANYAQLVRVHIAPALGAIRLTELTAEQVDDFLRSKVEQGLGRSHVGRMRSLLAAALRHAEARGLVPRNVAALSVMPKTAPPAERQALTVEQARALLEAASGERIESAVVVGASVGLRPGELLGLRWEDIDLDGTPSTLTVSGSLKRTARVSGKGYTLARGTVKHSKDGLRTVALPPRAVAALRAQKARQAAERLAAGELWRDHGLVFARQDGSPVDPNSFRRAFDRIAKRAGLAAGFPYLMRHTCVSLALDAGASIEDVADLLGDDPRTLYRYYRHKVRPVADASLRMERVLAGGDGPASRVTGSTT